MNNKTNQFLEDLIDASQTIRYSIKGKNNGMYTIVVDSLRTDITLETSGLQGLKLLFHNWENEIENVLYIEDYTTVKPALDKALNKLSHSMYNISGKFDNVEKIVKSFLQGECLNDSYQVDYKKGGFVKIIDKTGAQTILLDLEEAVENVKNHLNILKIILVSLKVGEEPILIPIPAYDLQSYPLLNKSYNESNNEHYSIDGLINNLIESHRDKRLSKIIQSIKLKDSLDKPEDSVQKKNKI